MALAFLSAAQPAEAEGEAAPRSAASFPQRKGNPLADLRIEDLSVTRDRPLFSPSRRPPPRKEARSAPLSPAAAPEAKAETPAPPPFDLVGAVIGEALRYVLVRSRATQEVTRLGLGDEKDGWRVGAVSLRSVELEHDGRIERLDFGPPAALSTPQPPQLAGLSPRPVSTETPDAANSADSPPIAESKRLKRKFNLR